MIDFTKLNTNKRDMPMPGPYDTTYGGGPARGGVTTPTGVIPPKGGPPLPNAPKLGEGTFSVGPSAWTPADWQRVEMWQKQNPDVIFDNPPPVNPYAKRNLIPPKESISPLPSGAAGATAASAYDPRGIFGTRQWTDWDYTGQGVDPSWIQQQWYRNPSWAAHQIWNPDVGFQNIVDVEKAYAGAGGPVQDIFSLGFNPQMAASFAGTKAPEDKPGGGAGAGTAWDWGNVNWPEWQGGEDWGQGWTSGFEMESPGEFPYPQQWQTASDVMTQFAEGLPTSTETWWEAQQAPLERRISDLSKQAAEQMGLGGLRWSTPLTRNIADITGRETADLWSNLATQQLGLTEAAKNRGLQAAGMLSGLGQQYLQAPQDWASQMYQMGAGMTGLGQQGLDRSYQDWLRTTAENNPWLAQALGFAGLQSQMVPQQYQQSFLSQLLGFGGSILPLGFLTNWGRS